MKHSDEGLEDSDDKCNMDSGGLAHEVSESKKMDPLGTRICVIF